MPVVSIIVRCYNYGHFIAETLESVFAQTAKDWECIVVDDGSTDNSRAVIESFVKRSDRIKYFYQKNSGLSAAMNLGLSQVSGDFIQFLDADDLISPGKLASHLQHFSKNSKIDVSYTSAKYFKNADKSVLYASFNLKNKEWIPKLSCSGFELIKHLVSKNIMPVNSPVFRKSALKNLSGFDEEMVAVEDWEFLLRASLHGLYFEHLDDPSALALVRVHENSYSQNSKKMNIGAVALRLKLPDLIKSCSALSDNESASILKITRKKAISACSRFLLSQGLLNDKALLSVRRFDFFILCLSYLGAMRKTISRRIRTINLRLWLG